MPLPKAYGIARGWPMGAGQPFQAADAGIPMFLRQTFFLTPFFGSI